MNIQTIMQLIKKDERFKSVFHFETDSQTNFNFMLPTKKLRKQFSFVKWIYLSTLSQSALIGIIKENNKVFTMDTDGSTFVLCDSYFEIPFIIIDIYLREKNIKYY